MIGSEKNSIECRNRGNVKIGIAVWSGRILIAKESSHLSKILDTGVSAGTTGNVDSCREPRVVRHVERP
jgi:hypothetical protein